MSKLVDKINEYLRNEEHETNIADSLFTVVKERVCALVSRIQGTFEFEVQPLREYFCAKYLYKTSPYAPVGITIQGTKPDRFEAIARNFYWQNVVRFFAGCFDRGELPMLVQKLNELQEDEYLKYTDYPRIIIGQLLSDYVFTQYPRLLKDAISLIIGGIDIKGALNQDNRFSTEPILLPEECGRKELNQACFNNLQKFPKGDYAMELISIIKNNPHNNLDKWINFAFETDNFTKWLSYGYALQLLHKIEKHTLLNVIRKQGEIQLKVVSLLAKANRIDLLEEEKAFKQYFFDSVLDNKLYVLPRAEKNLAIASFSFMHHPFIISRIINHRDFSEQDSSMTEYINVHFYRHYDLEFEKSFENFVVEDNIDKTIESYFSELKHSFLYPIYIWRNS